MREQGVQFLNFPLMKEMRVHTSERVDRWLAEMERDYNAACEGLITKDDIEEHSDRDCSRETAETSSSNRIEHGTQK